MEGEWVNGLLEGEVKDHMNTGGWLEGYYRDGVPHGFFREFGPRLYQPARYLLNLVCRFNMKHILKRFGRYYRGVPRGWWWFGHYDNSGWTMGKVRRAIKLFNFCCLDG